MGRKDPEKNSHPGEASANGSGGKPEKPSEIRKEPGFFDRFAQHAADFASRAPFFAFCVLILLLWVPSYLVLKSLDTWQLIINTATTIITFLLVALLQNTQTRNDQATQHKLNAIADALADLMEHVGGNDAQVNQDVKELAAAVGLEEREHTS